MAAARLGGLPAVRGQGGRVTGQRGQQEDAMTGYHVKRTQVADTSTAHHLHDRLVTPDSDPGR